MKTKPFILSIIGKPDSGKTSLILKLLAELKKLGYRVAVAKHCPHGFDLDIEGKDSWRFSQAGSEGIFLTSDEQFAVIRPKEASLNLKNKLKDYFSDFDIVLMEGYNNETEIKKIQIIRRVVGGQQDFSDDIVAYISDMSLNTNKPIYAPDDIAGIVSFIETLRKN
ncbi:MAG: molybdopterin-guanine dinucleotide biosynthesis protein B [Candidatus Omnitrophica bacterium]|nr:molybdopterin-guanine dinucleotide biosynthesis protein B [Candidatus Omnitrophota bacterium]